MQLLSKLENEIESCKNFGLFASVAVTQKCNVNLSLFKKPGVIILFDYSQNKSRLFLI